MTYNLKTKIERIQCKIDYLNKKTGKKSVLKFLELQLSKTTKMRNLLAKQIVDLNEDEDFYTAEEMATEKQYIDDRINVWTQIENYVLKALLQTVSS